MTDNLLFKTYRPHPLLQSHLIREFKKFTGFTPGDYIRRSNRLGTIFFNE